MPSLFGWLDNFNFWNGLPYPTKGALLRALKAGASVAVGLLLAAATAGTLLPPETAPYIVAIVTALLQAADKYIREAKLAEEMKDVPLTDSPDPDKVVVSNEATDTTDLSQAVSKDTDLPNGN